MNWIAIKDKMPDYNQKVLCLMKNGRMLVAFHIPFYGDMWRSQSDAEYVSDMGEEPVYWMPLPDAPTDFTPEIEILNDLIDIEQTYYGDKEN